MSRYFRRGPVSPSFLSQVFILEQRQAVILRYIINLYRAIGYILFITISLKLVDLLLR